MPKPDIARVTGSEDDGWNVEMNDAGHRVTFACEDREDADELCMLLNDCPWITINRT